MLKANRHYRELFVNERGVRYFILMGGRGAGRSTAGSQYVLQRLRDTTKYFRCAIMRFVLGDIRNSIFQDILDRIEEEEVDDDVDIREHVLKFTCGKNTVTGIGFRKSSSDQKSKLKSLANFNCIVIEEADEVSEEDFQQLDDSLRTKKSDIVVILQLNPPDKNHWIIKRWFNLEDVPGVEGFYIAKKKKSATDTCVISTTYRQNLENINDTSIANYEEYKETKPDHYWNMIKGYVSEGKRGRIFRNWKPITAAEYDALPYEEIFGLDFGFTNDPTALIGVKRHNRKVYVRQYVYETGLTNPMISKRFEDNGLTGDSIIYADSAEPKSIRELEDLGWNVLPAEKGPDSVRTGVLDLIDREVHYTEDSEDIATESQEYMWRLDKNKEPLNEPEDKNNHAMDAIRYAVYTDDNQPFFGFT
jgi:phage terminase large subunit